MKAGTPYDRWRFFARRFPKLHFFTFALVCSPVSVWWLNVFMSHKLRNMWHLWKCKYVMRWTTIRTTHHDVCFIFSEFQAGFRMESSKKKFTFLIWKVNREKNYLFDQVQLTMKSSLFVRKSKSVETIAAINRILNGRSHVLHRHGTRLNNVENRVVTKLETESH